MSEKNEKVRPIDRLKETASDGLGAAKERFEDVAAVVGDRVRDAKSNASDKFREQYEVRAEQMRQGYSQVRKSTDELAEDVSDFVRDNPGKSIAISAAVGFLAGLLLRRRDH